MTTLSDQTIHSRCTTYSGATADSSPCSGVAAVMVDFGLEESPISSSPSAVYIIVI